MFPDSNSARTAISFGTPFFGASKLPMFTKKF
jgi:hypothetical protein